MAANKKRAGKISPINRLILPIASRQLVL